MPDVDVCISLISTNTCGLLKQCLESIYKIQHKAKIETWVVDNVSTDNTATMLREHFPQVHVITNTSREGYGANHNKVFSKTNARYILVLNEDTVLSLDTIDAMVAFMDSTPDAGIAGCKVFFGDGRLQNNAGRFPTFFGELLHFGGNIIKQGKKWYDKYKFMEDFDYNETTKVDWVSGCFFMIKTDVAKNIGGFHKDIFIYFEDAELCYRVKQKYGLSTYFFPGTSIIHYHGQSFDPLKFNRTLFAFQGSCVFIQTKYGSIAETVYRLSCKLLWSVYLILIFLISIVSLGYIERIKLKWNFYKYLLFEDT